MIDTECDIKQDYSNIFKIVIETGQTKTYICEQH